MAPFELTRSHEHPYKGISPGHAHFAPTPFRYPAFSAACIPFRWMRREQAPEIAKEYEIPWNQELELRADKHIGFNTGWVQALGNQKALLDSFFSAIQPQRSLCFFYAKRTPLADDGRRVLVAVGRVAHIGEGVPYELTSAGPLRSMLWERAIQHTIRPNFKDGFVLPYAEVIELANANPSLEPADYLAYAPDDHWLEFAYTSEHVGHDAAISSLLECQRAVRRSSSILPGGWDTPLKWIDARLGDLWKMRGPYPGLGAALTAFGVEHGNLVAYDIASRIDENEDPWPSVDAAFEDPKRIGHGLDRRITPTLSQAWRGLPPERRNLLRLIARFDINANQAARYYVPSERTKAGIQVSDAELLANPYLLYELDRASPEAISVMTVDRGVFPDPIVREKHPLESPSGVGDAVEPRRVRGLIVSVLENASANGDTLQGRTSVIQTLRDLAVTPTCPVTEDTIAIAEDAFADAIALVEMANGERAYQLSRLVEMGGLIRREVEGRFSGLRHTIAANWHELLDSKLGPVREGDEVEERARLEKASALETLAASRISVLIGPAGTGKTTLLSVLCSVPEIRQGGIRLLAPTGKSRVQLGKRIGGGDAFRAETIAQFLLRTGRYGAETGIYRRSKQAPVQDARTVIVDEASMLTEEMFGALLDGLRGVERLIIVGDPRQLPPIGSGRPFVDIVARLAPEMIESTFPRVGPSYAELTVRRRQQAEKGEDTDLDDLLLADWFSGQAPDPGADEIWDKIASNRGLRRIRLVPWANSDDLWERLLEVLVHELPLSSRDDGASFELSLGGEEYGGFIYFKRGKVAEQVEGWQILSPVRGHAHGVVDINRQIQRHFRRVTRERAMGPYRRIPKPFGTEEILYGDKVISTRNERKKSVWPKDGALEYVANGEIGIVVGQFKYKNANFRGAPWKLEVEFTSQPGFAYDYTGGAFTDEGDAPIELAYAITVHRSQGSEFGTTILVVPEVCRPLSRELLYTALTRQRNKVVILHQGDLTRLRDYAKPNTSEIARRMTNLFRPPSQVEVDDVFLEGNLIHRTRRGETVRSKSEVIIADLLYSKGVETFTSKGS